MPSNLPSSPSLSFSDPGTLNDMHEFQLAAHRWVRLTTSGEAPAPRAYLSLAVSSAGGGRIVAYGGTGGSGVGETSRGMDSNGNRNRERG